MVRLDADRKGFDIIMKAGSSALSSTRVVSTLLSMSSEPPTKQRQAHLGWSSIRAGLTQVQPAIKHVNVFSWHAGMNVR